MPKYPIYELLKEASKNYPIILSERRLSTIETIVKTIRSPEFAATLGSVSIMLILKKILEEKISLLFL